MCECVIVLPNIAMTFFSHHHLPNHLTTSLLFLYCTIFCPAKNRGAGVPLWAKIAAAELCCSALHLTLTTGRGNLLMLFVACAQRETTFCFKSICYFYM